MLLIIRLWVATLIILVLWNYNMKILNLYAGLGGNRKLWENCEVIAVEKDEKIAKIYQRLYPNDIIIVADAHEYLLTHYCGFDLIWSSPPCQSHSRMVKATRHTIRKYIDISLYQEILFLQTFCKSKFIVENVVPYYEPLIKPTKQVGRHLFWSNFNFQAEEVKQPKNFINRCGTSGKQALQEWLGIYYEENIYYENNHCPAQILRNCVHPKLGLQILESIQENNIDKS